LRSKEHTCIKNEDVINYALFAIAFSSPKYNKVLTKLRA